jgi:hypothetical protein
MFRYTLTASCLVSPVSLTPQGPFDLAEIATSKGNIAWKYTSEGGSGGQSSRYTKVSYLIFSKGRPVYMVAIAVVEQESQRSNGKGVRKDRERQHNNTGPEESVLGGVA